MFIHLYYLHVANSVTHIHSNGFSFAVSQKNLKPRPEAPCRTSGFWAETSSWSLGMRFIPLGATDQPKFSSQMKSNLTGFECQKMVFFWNLGVQNLPTKTIAVNESNEYFQFVKPNKRYVDQRLSHGTEVPTDFPAEITTTWASVGDVKIVKMVDLTEFNQ